MGVSPHSGAGRGAVIDAENVQTSRGLGDWIAEQLLDVGLGDVAIPLKDRLGKSLGRSASLSSCVLAAYRHY